MTQSERPADWIGRFRGYLKTVAELQLAPGLRAKMDASDVVQQTMLQAVQAHDRFVGESDPERAAWLRKILLRNLAHSVRGFVTGKRDLGRERAVGGAADETTIRLEQIVVAEQSSPSMRAMRNERWERLVDALGRLPEAQQDVLGWYYLEDASLAEIGSRLTKSPGAVAGLLKRGLRRLREMLDGQS